MSASQRVSFVVDCLRQQLHVLCACTKVKSAMQANIEKRMKRCVGDCEKVLDEKCLILYGARGTWWVCRGSIDDLGLSPSAGSR
jgi:hypothetical protein